MNRELLHIDNLESLKKRSKDFSLREGTVKSVYVSSGEITYLVDVIYNSNQNFLISCSCLVKFGGLFNYEEFIEHGYNSSVEGAPSEYPSSVKPGDRVVIAMLYGSKNQGVILGCLQHPARFSSWDNSQGPKWEYEFNGVRIQINSDGEYTLTYKGIPSNAKDLDKLIDGKKLSNPQYNAVVGGSFLKFKKDGSIELNDGNDEDTVQSIEINKTEGIVKISTGSNYIIFDQTDDSFMLYCAEHNAIVNDAYNILCTDYSLTASDSATIVSPKIAFGTADIELLDKLTQLIDNIGRLIIMTPYGPASSVNTANGWDAVEKDKADINTIKGII